MSTIENIRQASIPTFWAVDAEQSSVEFAVKTFWGLTTVQGRFQRLGGCWDMSGPGQSIELTIDPASVDTRNSKRDEHLRSADFFDVADHPRVRFASTRIRTTGDGILHVEGELEAAGVIVPIEFDATVRFVADELEVEATTTVDPRRFGMSSGHLGMIRPPAELHVRARLVSDLRR
jgi:polyisoprenoid-binding protein YceI